jgi:hypothetical protein
VTFPIQLPPPSEALRLHQAAATIRRTAEAAQHDLDTESFWTYYPKATAWRDGFANGMGGKTGNLAGLFTPELALHIADWLDTTAAHAARHGHIPAPAAAIAQAFEPREESTP